MKGDWTEGMQWNSGMLAMGEGTSRWFGLA